LHFLVDGLALENLLREVLSERLSLKLER